MLGTRVLTLTIVIVAISTIRSFNVENITQENGDARNLIGGVEVTNIRHFPYIVYVTYFTLISPDLQFLTGVALNSRWAIVNPMVFEILNVIMEMPIDVTQLSVTSGTLNPLQSGKKHKVTKYASLPSLANATFPFLVLPVSVHNLLLLKVYPRFKCDVFPKIPKSPMKVNTPGSILHWSDTSVLERIEKKSAGDSVCVSVVGLFGLGQCNTFCTNSDQDHTVCFEGDSDPYGSPFIQSGHVLSGILAIGTCGDNGLWTEVMLDLGIFHREIQHIIHPNQEQKKEKSRKAFSQIKNMNDLRKIFRLK